MRILVADDDPVYQALVQEMLAPWDYQVLQACDGVQAWELLGRPDGPRLVLLDWKMPRMDGFEVCRRLRQAPDKQNVHVILMTAGRNKQDIIQVLVAGADDYLLKPFDVEDLQIRLRAARRILELQDEVEQLRRKLGTGVPGSMEVTHTSMG